METKSFRNRQFAAALIALGIATGIAFPIWAMENREEQMHVMLLRLLFVKSVQESTADAIIIFQTGQKGRLSRNHKDYQYYLKLAQRSVERQHPVGVRIDSAGEIGEIARADNDFVNSLVEKSEDRLMVVFQGHDGIAYLERQHPRFDTIERDLQRSRKEKKRIWFVWRLPWLTLEDVMIVEEENKATRPTEKTSIGSARMEEDGTIVLQLRAEGPGGLVGDALFRYPPNHPRYNDILRHLGGLKKGEEKQVPPWPVDQK